MRKRNILIGIETVLGCAIVLGNLGCSPTLAPVYVPVQTVGVGPNGAPYTAEQIERAILAGAQTRRWSVIGRSSGVVVAEIGVSSHVARVRVLYNEHGWRIAHEQSSPDLHYGMDERHGEVIHRRYNHWVRLLNQAIGNALVVQGWVPAGQPAPETAAAAPAAAPETAPAPAPEAAPAAAPEAAPATTPAKPSQSAVQKTPPAPNAQKAKPSDAQPAKPSGKK